MAATIGSHSQEQQLLQVIRRTLCRGRASVLARAIGRDGNYVARLFYPKGKYGGKGVGLTIIKACNEAFDLPKGYWDMDVAHAEQALMAAGPVTPKGADEPWPFRRINRRSLVALARADALLLEGAWLDAARRLGVEVELDP